MGIPLYFKSIYEDYPEIIINHIDGMNNLCRDAFSSWPERLYIIGKDGKVAYKGGLGPDGYLPDEVESWLKQHITL